MLVFGSLNQDKILRQKISPKEEPFRFNKIQMNEFRSQSVTGFTNKSVNSGTNQKSQKSPRQILSQPYSDVKFQNILREREITREIGVGKFISGKVRRNSVGGEIVTNHPQKLTSSNNHRQHNISTNNFDEQQKQSQAYLNQSSSSQFYLHNHFQDQLNSKQKLNEIILNKEKERGFRTGLRISLGGIRDRQGWSELSSGINVGDLYNEGFKKSGSFTRIRLHAKEIAKEDFQLAINNLKLRNQRNKSIDQSINASDSYRAIDLIKRSLNIDQFQNSLHEDYQDSQIHESGTSNQLMPKLYMKSLEETDILHKLKRRLKLQSQEASLQLNKSYYDSQSQFKSSQHHYFASQSKFNPKQVKAKQSSMRDLQTPYRNQSVDIIPTEQSMDKYSLLDNNTPGKQQINISALYQNQANSVTGTYSQQISNRINTQNQLAQTANKNSPKPQIAVLQLNKNNPDTDTQIINKSQIQPDNMVTTMPNLQQSDQQFSTNPPKTLYNLNKSSIDFNSNKFPNYSQTNANNQKLKNTQNVGQNQIINKFLTNASSINQITHNKMGSDSNQQGAQQFFKSRYRQRQLSINDITDVNKMDQKSNQKLIREKVNSYFNVQSLKLKQI
eukprot:403363060